MKMIKNLIFLALLITVLACTNEPRKLKPKEIARQQEDLIRVNKYLVGKDADIIKGFIKRHNWEMQTSKTGLRYMIYQYGKGDSVTEGHKVTINYQESLLDGTLCYSSDKLGPKKFNVGKGEVESGLDEGVRMLRVGDKARFILPPHLAHGLIGDQDQIPARSIVLIDVEVISVLP